MQEANHNDTPQGERALRKKVFIASAVALCMLAALIKYQGVFGHFQRLESQVVDSATSEPLEGVLLVALYKRACVGNGMREALAIASQESVTSEGGKFTLDEKNVFTAPGPKSFNMGVCQFAPEPDLYLFKPGYKPLVFRQYAAEQLALEPQAHKQRRNMLRVEIASLETMTRDKELERAAPAFYGRLMNLLKEKRGEYFNLQNNYIGDLQKKLRDLKELRKGSEEKVAD